MRGKLLSEKIKQRRIEIDYTQQDLSEKAGLNVSTIKAIETGRSETSYENIKKIAKALGVALSDIYLEDYRDTKVIAIANNKGGCGKTSVAASLGYALSEINENRILMVDSDMQMNLSHSYNIDRNEEVNLDLAMRKEEDLSAYILKTIFENIDIIISDYKMATMEMTLFTKTLRETVFKRILQPIVDKGIYDYILIDTNPTLGILNLNILNASDYIFIPVEMSAFGVLGLDIIIDFINQVQAINNKLQIGGIIRTKVDKREGITKEVDELLKKLISDKILNTYISIDTNVKRSQWRSDPLFTFKLNSRVAKQYRELAKEVTRIVK